MHRAMRPNESFGDYLRAEFGGVLRHGQHEPNGEACVLEVRSQALGLKWTDSPGDFPDLRPLNDALWPDDPTRTSCMVPVVEALWDWPEWSNERRVRFAKSLSIRIIKEILPPVLRNVGLDAEAARCENEGTAEATRAAEVAEEAAEAAAWAAWAARAGRAAEAAARAAEAAATAARAAGDNLLKLACRIFVEEANASK